MVVIWDCHLASVFPYQNNNALNFSMNIKDLDEGNSVSEIPKELLKCAIAESLSVN